MKTLQRTLEGLLDSEFDISEDDIQPLKNFARTHKASYWSGAMSGNNINGEFLRIVLHSYGKMLGRPADFDLGYDFLQDVAKSGDSFMIWRPSINNVEIWTCDKPRSKPDSVRWTLHTQNPRIMRASWIGQPEPTYRDMDVIRQAWNNRHVQAGKEAKLIRLNGRKALDEIIAGLDRDSK